MTETLTPQRKIEAPSKTEPRKVTVADVLERAADLLGEFGWCRGRLGTKSRGEFCLVGAVTEAHRDMIGPIPEHDPGEYDPDEDAYRFFNRHYEPIVGRGFVWNDRYVTDKAEVISVLRAAASSARTKEEA